MILRNKKETLSQNYRRLGLTAKLQHPTGGIEKFKKNTEPIQTGDGFRSDNGISGEGTIQKKTAATLVPQEVSIERDPQTGAIIRILSPQDSDRKIQEGRDTSRVKSTEKSAALDESTFSEWVPDVSSDDDSATVGPKRITDTVVSKLERQAGAVKAVSKRKQSTRELEWLNRLEARYGEDYTRMARDMKLNPMQQSEGDIRRRFKRWKEGD